MLDHEKEKILYRILSGKTILRELRLDVFAPSLDLLYESEEIYSEYYEKSGVLTKEQLRNTLLNKGIISIKDMNYVKDFTNILQNLQKELCANFEHEQAKDIKKLIEDARAKYSHIMSELIQYETYCKDGLSSYAKSIFLIRNTTYRDNKLYDFSDKQPVSILEQINKKIISNDDIREIAKDSSWSNTWYSFKGMNIFKNFPTTEQQLLTMWSKVYDNIRESEEPPSEELLKDNDATDGWLILNKEKSDSKKKSNNKKLIQNSKINNSEEVFIVAKTKEDIDNINKMNSKHAQRIKEQRLAQIYEKGKMYHSNFTDVKLDIQDKYHKMVMERVKKK